MALADTHILGYHQTLPRTQHFQYCRGAGISYACLSKKYISHKILCSLCFIHFSLLKKISQKKTGGRVPRPISGTPGLTHFTGIPKSRDPSSNPTGDTRSDYFSLSRGTRQGCPLSPLLFALAIEPLSIALRSSPLLQGIYREGIEHRVSLYADDLLLYVANPATAIPSVISILNEFGSFSGYKLNLQKSECFKLNSPVPSRLVPSFPFRLSEDGFKYLGIHITKSFTSLHASNLTTLVNQMKDDFKRWSALPLTLSYTCR